MDPSVLKVYKCPFNKLRLGKDYDGGYIIAEIPNVVYTTLLAGGIDNDITFEEDFINKYPNVKSFAFDGTINNLPKENCNITFIKKNIGFENNDKITNLHDIIDVNDSIFVKMDIEGGEIPWIKSLNHAQLNKFNQVVMEFHWPFSENEIDVFETLNKHYYLIHFHGNNCCGVREHKGVNIPNVFECTYLHKKFFTSIPALNTDLIPSLLDMKNTNNPEIYINYPPFVNIPGGSYLNSSKFISLEGDILTCDLATCSGTYVRNTKRIYSNINYHNINGVLTPYDYENSYFISIGNQLGNCLRIITSGLIIADTYKKHPFICLYNINNNKERFIIEYLFRQYILYNKVDFNELDYDKYTNYKEHYYTNYNLIDEGKFTPQEKINNYGITNSIYSIIPTLMTDDEYIKNKINIYKNLSYPAQLREKINSFILKNNISECIGVHIRYTDNFNCINKVKRNLNTEYATFIEKLNSIINVTYFIVSDSNDILLKISSDVKNKIIFSDKCFDDKLQPFYEMNILSKCKYIIGSNSSTFSYESAFLIGTDIELYENNIWNLYNLSKY